MTETTPSAMNGEKEKARVKYSHGRVIVRCLPGFTWVQVGVRMRWRWNPKGFWSVRGIAKSRHFGPLWICTMRTDAVERGKRSGLFTTDTSEATRP